jgi:deoxyribodipyrimidine photo-lyase
MGFAPSIVWLRDDLRVTDNPALMAAVERGGPVVVVYLLDEVSEGIRPLGAATRWWLHHSLTVLAATLDTLGASLTLRRGAAEIELPRLVDDVGAGAVFWNRRYGAARDVDARLKSSLREAGLEAQSFQANLLFEPWTITTGEGNPYRVFTPFWRACLERGVDRDPLPPPTSIEGTTASSESLDDWDLLPARPDWASGLRETWTPGEAGAGARLDDFVSGILGDYHRRDEPGAIATSGLSPHVRFGEISPFQIWQAVRRHPQPNGSKFLSELGWREFNWSILYTFPRLHLDNYRSTFDAFPWQEPDPAELAAWKSGRTGIPLIDAGMRELWHTGSMHNRVRMVVASFLIKNLLVDWRLGEAWFWNTLVDADEASNPGNWQWVAGSGADAAPYFRVFNPVLQADKFDKDRRYIRRWVPEFEDASYPDPIVDLAQSRKDALAAYEHVKATQ